MLQYIILTTEKTKLHYSYLGINIHIRINHFVSLRVPVRFEIILIKQTREF